jgi:DNA-binding CsgD family transcriptional regulator/PAS domain-containing protein
MNSASSDLLNSIYAAPASPELWPSVLTKLGDALGLNACAIVHTDLNNQANSIYVSNGVDPDVERLYAAGYGAQDVYRPRFLRMRGRQGDLLMGDELCTPREMTHTAFYTDILHKADIRLWCAVATVHSDNVLENISLYHSWKKNAPSEQRLAQARVLTPHLNNALRLRAKLAHLAGLAHDLYAALDASDSAMILLDSLGQCCFLNKAARGMLDRRDGLTFSNNRISATDSREASKLLSVIRKASADTRRTDKESGTLRITRERGKPLHVRVVPFPGERLGHRSQFAAIALIGDPNQGITVPPQMLQTIYGLTPAEARLSVMLSKGQSMAEAAAANGVTDETVRSQLKSVFHKTGTRRQSELISLLVSLPGGMA